MSPHSEVVLDDESKSVRSVPTNGTTTNGINGVNGVNSVNGVNGTNGVNGYPHSSSSPSPSLAALGNGLHSSLPSRRQQRIHKERSAYLTSPSVDADGEYDLICVGYGPASLGVAVAMHDALASGRKLRPDGSVPRVLFLEQQARFAWHAGMLLQGARMQISFVKDLASLRDPRSEFTFLNYLHRQGRLVEFTNLGTFLPARNEYEDYLRWCASFFDHLVRYNSRVVSVAPNNVASGSSVRSFTVQAQNIKTGQLDTYRGRNILLATGGQPALPKSFPVKHPRVIHSSQYAHLVPQLLPKSASPYRVVVVGAGQSAAEIFRNIQHLYPNSQTWLVMRQEFLKPSDDSPFVNSVFNPEFVDNVYPRSPRSRQGFLDEVRATNYGVVRLELIEELYETMYDQMRELGRDETKWPHRIMASRHITSIEPSGDKVEVKVQRISQDGSSSGNGLDDFVDLGSEESIDADLVIAATGYNRSGHVDMLRDTWSMLPKAAPSTTEYKRGIAGWNVATEQGERKMAVGRDYRVKYAPGAIADESGIWLQGLCEGTHGVSDTLLSVIATRSGEIVDSIFGREDKQ